MHHFVSFVSARLFYVVCFFFLPKILSKSLSISWLRTSASSCAQVYECHCQCMLETSGPVVLLCSSDVVEELDEAIYEQVRVSLQLRPGVHPWGCLA